MIMSSFDWCTIFFVKITTQRQQLFQNLQNKLFVFDKPDIYGAGQMEKKLNEKLTTTRKMVRTGKVIKYGRSCLNKKCKKGIYRKQHRQK